jgi:hypothetical protein
VAISFYVSAPLIILFQKYELGFANAVRKPLVCEPRLAFANAVRKPLVCEPRLPRLPYGKPHNENGRAVIVRSGNPSVIASDSEAISFFNFLFLNHEIATPAFGGLAMT